MVSTTEGFTDNIHISHIKPTPFKKPSARKSLCMFINVIDVNKTMLIVALELLNLIARRLHMEIHHRN